ncbi:MAG: hypothetical protein AAGA77_05455 [Bacteroidota bacterium]
METNEETNYILETPFLNCMDHEIIDLAELGLGTVRGLVEWSGFTIIYNLEGLIVRSGSINGNTVIQKDIHVRNILITDEYVYLTSFDGLFSVDKEGEFTQHLNEICEDIVLTSGGDVVLTVVADFMANRIMKLENDFSLTPYSDNHQAESKCVPLQEIEFIGDKDIFATTCDGYVVHFENREFKAAFGMKEMNLPGVPASKEFFLASHEDDLIVVAKKSSTFYSILKYKAEGEWIDLKTFERGTQNSQKDVDMRLPNISDIMVYEDKLYVATTNASCWGIHEFDLSKNESLTENDYHIIQDPNFPSQCLRRFWMNESGNISVVTNDSKLVKMKCR